MHFHIVWGPNTAEEPSVIDYTGQTEAIDKFIDIVRTVEGADKPPPTMEESILDNKTKFFRMVTATHKYILICCSNGCHVEIPEQNSQRTTLN